jgi:hypothetical protein
MSDSWEKVRVIEAETKLVEAQARDKEAKAKVLAESKHTTAVKLFGLSVLDVPPLFIWGTLWLSQILTWGFLMMVFRKDVFPR